MVTVIIPMVGNDAVNDQKRLETGEIRPQFSPYLTVIRQTGLRPRFPTVSCYETAIFLHRFYTHFWSDGLRRRFNAVFRRFIAVSGSLRTVLLALF